MKKLAASLLPAFLLAPLCALAGTPITTAQYSISVGDWSGQTLALASESGNIAVFNLNWVYPPLSVTSAGVSDGEFSTMRAEFVDFYGVGFSMRDGYRVSSLTLSGDIDAQFRLAAPVPGTTPAALASAHGGIGVDWEISRPGAPTVSQDAQNLDVLQDGRFVFTFSAPEMRGDFNFAYAASAFVEATGYSWYSPNSGYQHIDTTAALQFSNIQLTVQVVPVPEPSTYGMLLAGLAVVTALGRKRKGGGLSIRSVRRSGQTLDSQR